VHCKIQESSRVNIANRCIEVAEKQIVNRGKSSECPALEVRVNQFFVQGRHSDVDGAGTSGTPEGGHAGARKNARRQL
jgi:hypothetical protein